MMAQAGQSTQRTIATAEDVVQIFGEIERRKILQILSLEPTLVELEEASVIAGGDDDILRRAGRAPSGNATQISEILTADEDEPDPGR